VAKTIIVTGAAGFIGRNVVAELNRRGHTDDLLLVDRLGTDEKWKNLLGLRFDDLVDPDRFLSRIESGAVEPPNALIHLGACSSTTERDADFLLRNNYRYTRTLCEWAAEKSRFVYASSGATYGDGGRGYSDEDAATLALEPLNMYGYSKHMFDLWAMSRGVLDRIVGLKYFNVYGPYEDHKGDMRSVVHKAYEQIAASGNVKLFKSYLPRYKDGEQKRDFIYVRDAVDVTLHFALDHPQIGGLFNCGTGQARSWNDLAKAVFAAMGRKPKIEYIDMPPTLRAKYQYFTQAEMNKLRTVGKYAKDFTSLEDGVRQYTQNYLMKR
jgi:ADP-L-glycero-D-manno-heptose 6-epimerase